MTLPDNLVDRVAEALVCVSAEAVEPWFEQLAHEMIEEKSPGEVVTAVDRAAELALERHLLLLVPRAAIVGEEACAADPTKLRGLEAEVCWVVDPLDGTANFVAGSSDWALMIGLLRYGEPVMAWIWQPAIRSMHVAERGAGATCNGVALRTRARTADPAALSGAVLSRFLPPTIASAVRRNAAAFGAVHEGRRCAGVEYPSIVHGHEDFAIYWRTLPWDHVPGVLLLEEAGGMARRPNGALYRPSEAISGLVAVADPATFDVVAGLVRPASAGP